MMLKPGAKESDQDTVPLGRLQSPFMFGSAFTEALASEVNQVVEAFNARLPEERSRIYEDFVSRSGERVDQAFKELLEGLELTQLVPDGTISTLRSYFDRYAVPPAEGEVLVVKMIDLIAAS